MLSGWSFMRILRLVLGIIIVVQGIATKEWAFAVLGSLFVMMPLLNIGGCCGAPGCGIPASRSDKEIKDVSYEEVR